MTFKCRFLKLSEQGTGLDFLWKYLWRTVAAICYIYKLRDWGSRIKDSLSWAKGLYICMGGDTKHLNQKSPKKWPRCPDQILFSIFVTGVAKSAIFVLHWSAFFVLIKNKVDFRDILWKSRIPKLQHSSGINFFCKTFKSRKIYSSDILAFRGYHNNQTCSWSK